MKKKKNKNIKIKSIKVWGNEKEQHMLCELKLELKK